MQLSIVTGYRLDLTQEEFNLIGLALCGRLKPDQIEAAHELNKRLLGARRRLHAEHVALSDRAIESLGYEEEK